MIYKKYNKKFKLTYTKMLDKEWPNRDNKINLIAEVDENAKNDIIKILSSTDDKNVKKILSMVVENCDIRISREFRDKKNKYMEENRTLTDDQFNSLYLENNRKVEITQSDLGMCMMYTVLEILKKTNFFNEMIKTHLKENKNYWEVKIPFFSKDWIRVKVWKSEINNRYSWEIWWEKYKFCINSKSKLDWFKILEIALIKMLQCEPWPNWEEHELDLKKTWDCKIDPESILYHTKKDYVYKLFKILFGKLCVTTQCQDELKDIAYKYFNRWVYWIELSLDKNVLEDNSKSISIDGNTIKHWKKIKTSLRNNQCFTSHWKDMIRFFENHSYSMEKCYISKEWEKRCWIVNPRHTDIKFDINFEDCKKFFKFNIIWFDYENMFE